MLFEPNSLSLVPPASFSFPASAAPGVLMPTSQEPLPHRRVVDLTGVVRVERRPLVAVTTATLTEALSIADALGQGELAVSQQSPILPCPLQCSPPAQCPSLPHCYRYRWHC